MPSLAMYRITPPTDYAEFEKISKDFLVHKYKCDASLFGRKGQKQKGIDIVLTMKDYTYVCAQCKNTKSVSKEDIDNWILKAEECAIPMTEFVVVVSVENDAVLQEHVCKTTTKRVKEGKIPVKLFFWDDVIDFVKKDQDMLRLYYPEFYHAEVVKLSEASQLSEDKYPEIIRSDNCLLNLFFENAVKYSVELFLNCSCIEGISMDLIGDSEAFYYSIKMLLYRSPMLTAEQNYNKISAFLAEFSEYTNFLPNITESVLGVKVIATIRYNTNKEKEDIKKAEELRQNCIFSYNKIKDY